jgi:hypothetical protein
MRKRSGQEHGIDVHFPHRMPGSVMVPCFACPEPGFNMDEDDDMDEEDIRSAHKSQIFGSCSLVCRHATTLFLSADGHFGLMQKLKNNDPDDVSLLAGAATFPQEDSYQEYIKTAAESTEVLIILTGMTTFSIILQKSTCTNLRAANAQNKIKFRGCSRTGVVSINCGRHSIFRHQGMVDLQKGER